MSTVMQRMVPCNTWNTRSVRLVEPGASAQYSAFTPDLRLVVPVWGISGG